MSHPSIRRRSRPRLESLESRVNPVNNVQSSFNSLTGTLTITSVDQPGEAEILAGDNNQNFQILGDAAITGKIALHKSGATTIDGGIVDVLFTDVKNIVIDLKDGDDFITTKILNIAGDLTFKGGDGGNSLNVDSDTFTTKVRNITFTNGDGVDNFAFLDGDHIVSGTLTINFGDGGSNSNIGFNAGDDVTIQGAVNITGAAGADNVNFFGNDFKAKSTFTIKGGTGDNDVRINLLNSAVFSKLLSITNLAGDDVFSTGNGTNKSATFTGITINNGPGKSDISFDSDTFDTITGNLTIINGAGDDKFTADSGTDFKVSGSVTINNGTGNTATDISPAAINEVGGLFKLTNLAGTDVTTIGGATVNYKGVVIANGNNDSTTALNGTNLSFSSISSTNGDGLNTFTVTATGKFEVLVGGITLKNGTGGSATTINATGAAPVAIKGAVSITNGDGNDTTTIGNGAGKFDDLHNVTISNGAGTSATTFNPTTLKVTGSVIVTNGDGFDTFALGNGATTDFNVSANLKVTHGLGGSISNLNPTAAGAIGLGLTVISLDGNDTVDLIRTTVSGTSSFSLGAGNDKLDIDNSILSALLVLGGSGGDQVRIEATTNDGIGTTILGTATMDLGAGDDSLEFGLDINDEVTTTKAVSFKGGIGFDAFDQHAATNTFAGLSDFEIKLP